MAGMGGYGQGTQNVGGWSNLSRPTPGTQRRTRPSPFGHGYQTSLDMTTGGRYVRRGGGSGGMAGFAPHVGSQQQMGPYVNQGMNGLMPPPSAPIPGPSQPGPMGGLIGAMPMLPREGDIAPVEDAQATREAYARAKDTAGQHGRAALDALMDLQGARGIVGSGIGVNEAGGVIAEGARQLGDFNREQAIQRVENERRRQEMNYQGRINQRGQDLSWQDMELQRRRWNAQNSPYGHIQGDGVNPIPGYPRY